MKTFSFAQSTDVDEYEAGLQAFLDGRMAEERFTPFRLQMGVYGQRQEGVQMVRAKLPGGNISPEQLDMIGDCVERFAGQLDRPKVAHITTRQDIQANFVDLKDTLPFLRALDDVGLTTREACGNTVRNVSSCFLAGVCPAEHVDVSLHARRFAEYFLRHPLAQQFPRKFKVSFSGCATDCALSGMHDVGFVATRNAAGEAGFTVWAAGGLSSQPMKALLLEDFIAEQDILLVGEALMRMHFKFSDRKRRARARLKYVAQKLGEEGFIEEYRKQRAVIESIHRNQHAVEPAQWRDAPQALDVPASGVVKQHDGTYALVLNIFRGDLTPEQCHAIADTARAVGTSGLQVTTEQGMVITGVAEDKVQQAQDRLHTAGLTTHQARGIADAVACPGTETCRLGITSSRGLVEALRSMLDTFQNDPVLGRINIKASGCQHSCARHHVADLGFHGLAKKVQGQAVPHYQLHIGGSGRGGEAMGFATDAVPARNAPEAGIAVLKAYREQRQEEETLHDWASRIGADGMKGILQIFGAGEGDVEGLIYDWSENEAFNTKGNKKGECAGAVLSMSDALTSEAEYELMMARAHLDGMFWAEAITALRRGATSTARAYLVTYGEVPENDTQVFASLAVHGQSDSDVMSGLHAVQGALMEMDLGDLAASAHTLQSAVAPWLALALKRFAAVPAASEEQTADETAAMTASNDAMVTLDLTGVACPMNFVKTKIKLTSMAIDAELAVILDDGAPIENVPLSLQEQGQTIVSKERVSEQQWRIVVKKSSAI